MRTSWLTLFGGFLFCSWTMAADMPHAKDHEFNPNMPAQLMGKDVALKTADGQSFAVYETGPADAKRGILVIHEWWGLNDHIRGWADRYAKLGYRAVAVDLYDGQVASDPDQAGKLMQAVKQPQADAKLKAALQYLQAPGRKLATIGWCFGGSESLQATLTMPEAVSATVIYYGEPVTDIAKLKTLRGPVLGLYAGKDGWITPAKVEAFKQAMAQAGKTLEAHSYDADHAFANPSGQRYDSAAAKAAWEVSQSFLDKNLQ